MADIALGAEISREFLAGFLQEINSHGTGDASHSVSGTEPHKLNDAAGHARQIQDVVDRNPIVDDIAPVASSCWRNPARKLRRLSFAVQEGRAQDWNRL